jgi:hypothetical protein
LRLWIPRFVEAGRTVPCKNPLCQKKLDKDKHEFCPLTWKGSEHPAVVLATRHCDLEGKGRELQVTFAIVRISSFWNNEHDNLSRVKDQPDAFYLFDCTQQFLSANRDLEQSYFFENGIGAEKSNWAILQHSRTLPYSEFKTFGKITGPFYHTACDFRLDEKSYPKLVNQVGFPGHEEFVSTDKLRHGTGWWLVQTAKKFGEGSLHGLAGGLSLTMDLSPVHQYQA